ncbi:hypothetical protein P8452_01454 [Trifolium repens]|nr:hypothetical protein P8452_01454 [Trifolium repens]
MTKQEKQEEENTDYKSNRLSAQESNTPPPVSPVYIARGRSFLLIKPNQPNPLFRKKSPTLHFLFHRFTLHEVAHFLLIKPNQGTKY